MLNNKDIGFDSKTGTLTINGLKHIIGGATPADSRIINKVIDGEAVGIPEGSYLIIVNSVNGDPLDDDTYCLNFHTVNNMAARIAGSALCSYSSDGEKLLINSLHDSDEPIDVFAIKLD